IPGVMHYLLMSLVAATTVGALGAVGAILALGLIVIPPVTAHLLTDRLAPLIALTLAVAVFGSLGGVWLAYALNVSISGMIATVLGALCLAAVAFSPSKGVVVMQRRRQRQRRDFAIETLVVHLDTHRETEEEQEESRMGHLSQELKWAPEFAERVVREAERRRVVQRTGERLQLTESGKVAAERANDPSAAASSGSPRRSP
ncbi:MAG: metal ABC transporter permease, partial [Fimbriimonadaceae bacterium]